MYNIDYLVTVAPASGGNKLGSKLHFVPKVDLLEEKKGRGKQGDFVTDMPSCDA